MKIDKDWLEKKSACKEGVDWFTKQSETDGLEIVKKLVKEKQLNWANWLNEAILCRWQEHYERVCNGWDASSVNRMYSPDHFSGNFWWSLVSLMDSMASETARLISADNMLIN